MFHQPEKKVVTGTSLHLKQELWTWHVHTSTIEAVAATGSPPATIETLDLPEVTRLHFVDISIPAAYYKTTEVNFYKYVYLC